MAKLSFETHQYNNKTYTVPVFPAKHGIVIRPRGDYAYESTRTPVLDRLNTVWDIERFKEPSRPYIADRLSADEREAFAVEDGLPNFLDLPIAFPGVAEYRLPHALSPLAAMTQRVATAVAALNPRWNEYICYLTHRRGDVKPGDAQHEAPVHVDGFQGARWRPKKRINFTVTVADCVPTTYHVQPFDFAGLDEAVHNFFWEMNAQVRDVDSRFAWTGKPHDLELMDAYCAHRGTIVNAPARRRWLRFSFEERVFDRLGNAHNPLFRYDWKMVPRDIEQLGLVPFRRDADKSLNLFPWQAEDGSVLPEGETSKPRLSTGDTM